MVTDKQPKAMSKMNPSLVSPSRKDEEKAIKSPVARKKSRSSVSKASVNMLASFLIKKGGSPNKS